MLEAKLKLVPQNPRSRAIQMVIIITAAMMGVLLYYALSRHTAVEAQRAIRPELGQNSGWNGSARYTAALTFTPVVTIYLPIVFNVGPRPLDGAELN